MHYDRENQWYIEYGKLSNGQTAMIVFDKYQRGLTYYYYVLFGIADKKKTLRHWLMEDGCGDFDTLCTGKCGTEGLVWAFKKIEEFIYEREYWKNQKTYKNKIVVLGSDTRRYRIYRHFLKRLGFKEESNPEFGVGLVRNF